uniref:Uncharacterized protein n=1 Tax=Cacopsylla melanoneura TaxID=428564 RepID=A0A8D8ZN26_9HEMI
MLPKSCTCGAAKRGAGFPNSYNYLTFHQFKELKEIICTLRKKHYLKFIILFLMTMFYFALVSNFYLMIIHNLQINFTIAALHKGPAGSKPLNVWEILRASFAK